MPEEHWAAHGGTPACDLCHSRKVKCDRKDPCANCTASSAECLRTRQKRTTRPKPRTDDKIRALVEKLSSLENAVRGTTPPTSHSNLNANVIPPTSTNVAPNPRPPKRRRGGEIISTQEGLSPPDSIGSQQKRTNEGLSCILNELSHNGSLAENQRNVLETAMAFIDQLSRTSSSAVENDVWSHKVPINLTRSELVQIMIANQRHKNDASQVQLHTLDHIPPTALERMAVGLLEGTADSRTLNMYKVIVHFKAALNLYASQLQGPMTPTVRSHIKEMQLHHLSAALTAFDGVSFLTPPSLLLLQTLLTGAILMHIIGNTTSCWSLTAHASRTLVALGYHNLNSVGTSSEEEDEIHVAVAWCYHFDRLISLLLLRPPSLPPLDIPVSSLVKHDPGNPMSIFAKVMLEMVSIHEKILQLTLETASKRSARSPYYVNTDVEQLRCRMAEVFTLMEQSCPADLETSNADYLLHWRSLEFKYFSTLTSVHRLSPKIASDAWDREQCLRCARKALGYVKEIQHLGKQQGHFVEEYSPYLSWTILSYPLTPFFVIFCNVVGTSSVRDFELLQDIADSISSLVMENKYAEKLHILCNTLLAVCKPMVQQGTILPHVAPPVTRNETTPDSRDSSNPLAQMRRETPDAPTTVTQPAGEDAGAIWDNEMWQLFQCQPSLDWFDSDILDPSSWDLL
ncbi:hypothetical protein K458DRAFT_424966 [Lentithecium fluviatile CBS 122367]|uniref:Zn(2)-C6 fungal-type domain-containing protein n=1 Tax=Lentithecium fluviatile CBS 122367 TaxID=1168545 RepID=A0A6G1IDR4_9PLEO|nr:hypothetical protein K458DRAFT_424966 [Lentithecium fluviatile CBS 122367]